MQQTSKFILSILLFALLAGHVLAQSIDPQQNKHVITVAGDGSGQYRTVQAAFDNIPPGNRGPVTIYVRNGVYKEKLHLDSSKNFVTLIGEDKYNTILTYDDHAGKVSPAGDTINTRTSWSFLVRADNFTAKNLTFRNDAGFTAGQAVAVESDGDKAVFVDCRFIGKHIKQAGWSNWNNTDNYKTTRYAEYQNFGASADPSKRVEWARQLSGEEVKKYTLKNIFGNWNPLR